MKTKENSKINIVGAGIAGMTAAINLSKFGKSVTIYEKKGNIGDSRDGDFEGIENWMFSKNVSESIIECGIDFNGIPKFPIFEFSVHLNGVLPVKIKSQEPFFYIVKRGSSSGSFDNYLAEICNSLNVRFRFNQHYNIFESDINATGTYRAAAYIRGAQIVTDLPNQVHLLLGKQFAPRGYAYLIIIDGFGTIATAFKKSSKSIDPLNPCIQYFKTHGFDFEVKSKFANRGSFNLPKLWNRACPIMIGEAGGYQDYLFGFGMRMAMYSGLSAAYKLSGKNYQSKIINRDLNNKRRISFANRLLFENLSIDNANYWVNMFEKSKNPVNILRSAYNWNWKKIIKSIKLANQYAIRFS